jgi:metal-sulfur cluster biosynthetic enzyme
MRNPVDIYQMGLIDDVTFQDGRVRVTLCLTDPGCIHFSSMRQYITDVLLELPGIHCVEVCQTQDKLWTPDRMEDRSDSL